LAKPVATTLDPLAKKSNLSYNTNFQPVITNVGVEP